MEISRSPVVHADVSEHAALVNQSHPNASQESTRRYVSARFIAQKYGITERYVLQLAAEKKIPSMRLGRKCVRFNERDVEKAMLG